MASNGVRIAIIGEDQAHRFLVTSLADRVLLDEAARRGADWVSSDSLSWLRSFCGLDDDENKPEHLRFYLFKNAAEDMERLGRRPVIQGRPVSLSGHIRGKPLKPEAWLWRVVLLLFAVEEPPPAVLIVARDTDGDPKRLDGLRQALELLQDFEQPLPVIVAAPHQDAEAWFVAGFVPLTQAEEQRLKALRDELLFSPPDEAHRLTAHPNDAPTDAKRVLRVLAFDDDASRAPGLEELPELCERTLGDLALLRKSGVECGLREFLDKLREVLVPIFIPGPPAAED